MARALARAQPIPRPVLIRIVLDTLAGLHAAHELLDDDGQPRATRAPRRLAAEHPRRRRRLLAHHRLRRRPRRLAPADHPRRSAQGQARVHVARAGARGEVDRRADVFAMGIVLWEVLAGRRLFKAESEAVTLRRVMVEPIPRLSQVVPDRAPRPRRGVRQGPRARPGGATAAPPRWPRRSSAPRAPRRSRRRTSSASPRRARSPPTCKARSARTSPPSARACAPGSRTASPACPG